MITLVIPGKPFGKQAIVTTKYGGYRKPDTVNYMARVQSIFAGEYPGFAPFTGPLVISIIGYFPIPKSTSKKEREKMLHRIIRPTIKRADWDNIAKVIGDSLNNIAYIDDSQIVDGRVSKLYSVRPRVEITIREIYS